MFSQRGITQFAGYLHFWRATRSWVQRNPVINNIAANEPHRPPLWSFHPKFINMVFYSSVRGAEMLETVGRLQPTLADETRVRAALFEEIKWQTVLLVLEWVCRGNVNRAGVRNRNVCDEAQPDLPALSSLQKYTAHQMLHTVPVPGQSMSVKHVENCVILGNLYFTQVQLKLKTFTLS